MICKKKREKEKKNLRFLFFLKNLGFKKVTKRKRERIARVEGEEEFTCVAFRHVCSKLGFGLDLSEEESEAGRKCDREMRVKGLRGKERRYI